MSPSIKDRIRDYYHGANGMAVLDFIKEVGMAPELLFPSHDDSTDNEPSNIREFAPEKALTAYEEAAELERRNS